MPVTVRLSRLFHERLGDEIADEIANWFNQVDATYRGDLRELNELNFARFDAKLEQRVRESEARLDRRMDELDARLDRVAAELNAKIDGVAVELNAKIDRVAAELNAKIDGVAVELNAKIDGVAAELNAKIDRVAAEVREHLERRLGQQTRWYFVAWAAQMAAIVGLWFRN